MKKVLLLLLFVSPLLAQENNSEKNNTNMNKWINYNMKRRGYQNFEEYKYNSYGIVSIGVPINISVPYVNKSTYQIDTEITYLEHFKNKFYFTFNWLPTFVLNDKFLFMFGYSMGFGGTFFDSRDELGKGLLLGMDWESGIQAGLYAQENQDSRFNYFTGINARGLYRTNIRLGVSVAFQILYHYYPGNSDLLISERHEISVGSKIGIVF